MLTLKGHVKVMDFGLAKHLTAWTAGVSEVATATKQTVETSLTGEGAVIGTASYMSPEQVEGKPLDARSDIFSMGAVLYELLTGQKAFQGGSAISTMSAILRDAPIQASKVRRDVPHKLDGILNRCLEKDRGLRYASAASLHKELAEFQAQLMGLSTVFRSFLRPRIALPASLVLILSNNQLYLQPLCHRKDPATPQTLGSSRAPAPAPTLNNAGT
jgi:serine/threonine protein kinase